MYFYGVVFLGGGGVFRVFWGFFYAFHNVRTSLLTEFHHNLNDSVVCGQRTELRNFFGLTRRLSGNRSDGCLL